MYFGATDRTLAVVDDDHNILFLQLRTGRLAGGNSLVASVWEHFEQNPGVDLEGAIAAVAQRNGTEPAELSAQMHEPVAVLRRDGIITTRPPGEPPARIQAIRASETAQPTRREAADPDGSVPRRFTIAAAIGLTISIAVGWLPFWLQLEILIAVRRLRPKRPGLAGTQRLADAVARAARRYPGRTECLEQSIAAFVAGALLGAAPDWCHGGSLLSDTYHAWVQADRVAIDYTDQYQDGVLLTTMIRL